MDSIVPVIGGNWWTHLENPMALWFLVINALNLNLEWTDDNNQEFQSSVEKELGNNADKP